MKLSINTGCVVLFRLKLNPKKSEQSILGYKWIEVLALEPWTFHGEGTPVLRCMYVCRTELGLTQIASEDLWSDIGEGIYIETKRRSKRWKQAELDEIEVVD